MKNKGIISVIAGIMVIGVAVTLCTSSYITRQEEMESLEYIVAESETDVPAEEKTSVETFAVAAAREYPPEDQAFGKSLMKAVPDGEALSPESPEEAGEPSDLSDEMSGVALAKEVPERETATESAPESKDGADVKTAAFGIAAESLEEEEESTEVSPHHKRLMELDAQIQKVREEETESTTYSMKTAAENELKLWDSELNTIYNDILDLLDEEETKEMIKQEREWMKERDALAVEAAKRSAGGTLEGLEYTASLAESTRQRAYELADLYTQLLEEES